MVRLALPLPNRADGSGADRVRSVRRPATADCPAFDLAYVRRGRPGTVPVVVIPGGPGLGSIRMYRSTRARAARAGLDVVMMEHRGVGDSRRDLDGHDLPPKAVTLQAAADDLAAVLDAEGIERAVIAGCSYGTSVAQAFGVVHPGRVAGMVLDSTVLSGDDYIEVRRFSRARLMQGSSEHGTLEVARKIRALTDASAQPHRIGAAARVLYEYGGVALLDRYLEQLVRGQADATDALLHQLASQEVGTDLPGIMEFDLVARMAFEDLHYHPEPDGLPFDPSTDLDVVAEGQPAFAGEPYDFPAALPGFDWLTAVVSGARDLRTPRTVAEHTVALLPDGVLVPVADMGHSALDTRQGVFLAVAAAVRDGDRARLAEIARTGGDGIGPNGASAQLTPVLRALLAVEKPLSPLVRRVTRAIADPRSD
ncbi:MAG: alpha/beta hydrolase [Dermatophilus congolensis]|nr:alpha/beta hydrolase [Dermatophilus congolensis]